ncbi:hypothetical protein J6590_059389 [Homalodisca vitripennis]|nr:hypothetical protein J6590_059389 [Homalodisca vitripennis]
MCATTIDGDLVLDDASEKVESMDTDTGACVMDYNLKLPFKLRKRWAMEQKKANGTWLSGQSMEEAHEQNAGQRKKKSKEAEGGSTGGNCSGKRGRSDGSSVEKPLPKRRPTAPPEQAERASRCCAAVTRPEIGYGFWLRG